MTYNEERNKVMNTVIQNLFYEKGKTNTLELIISSGCNQKCEYCYLVKHAHKMYTSESNDKNNILHNLPILLDYLREIQYEFNAYDIFSGEFFSLPYWEDILEIIYNDSLKYPIPKNISIPTNMTFILDENKTKKVSDWLNKCKQSGINIHLSASVDGPIELENIERPLLNNTVKDEAFFDKLFTFMAKYHVGAHPMITKEFVKNYKYNYDFWLNNLAKYNVTSELNNNLYLIPMFLMVRDEEQWDKESLNSYKEFLWYAAKRDLEVLHKNDVQDFAMHMADNFCNNMKHLGTYNSMQPYMLAIPSEKNKIPCSIQSGLKIRVGDLKIVPCHRLTYKNLIFGEFILNEDKTKITHIQGDKVELMHKIFTFNPLRSMMKCSDCKIRAFCAKGCLGSQLERTSELFACEENVCDMYFTVYKTIHEIAEHYGIYDIVAKNIEVPPERRKFIAYVRETMSSLSI